MLRHTLAAVAVGLVSATAAHAQTGSDGKLAIGNFQAKGVKIAYAVKGKGEPVVLVHGLFSSGLINWGLTGVVDDLAKDHQVIIFDLPGHGFSDKPAKKEAYGAQLADDVVLLLDHLKIKKAHVVGYSLGGMITMKVLAKHPDRVLSGTVAGMGWFKEGSLPQKMLEKFKGGGFGPPQEFFDTIGGVAVSEDELKKIELPVRVLIGDKDICKQLYVEPLQKVRKDWTVVEIKDGDHLTAILRPQFKEEIGAWVRKNTK
jgi:pimeloyl-ACP methyl ester carboxylesterase